MRPSRPIFFAFFLWAGPAFADAEPGAVVASLTEKVALPSAAAFDAAAEDFHRRTTAGCDDPAALRAAEAGLRLAWAKLEVLNFGPLQDDNRASKIAFWPDKHGVAGRQIRQYLRKADPKTVTAEALGKGSVALQGLPALEDLLYGGETISPFACAFVQGIAGNLTRLAGGIRADWGTREEGYAARIEAGDLEADAPALYYRAATDALERVLDLKLKRPLGDAPEAANGALAEAAPSGRSAAIVAANLETVQALAVGPSTNDPGLADLADAKAGTRLKDALAERLGRARDLLNGLNRPLAEAVTAPEPRSRIEVARFAVKDAKTALATDLAPALGLPAASFNAADGD
ncbi:MAG: imelysin family protein [Geminicoccaceae bacterium]|nr:imelysin family protein [Geminicoccaceae bacterium]